MNALEIQKHDAIEELKKSFAEKFEKRAEELNQIIIENKEQYDFAIKEAAALAKDVKSLDAKRKDVLKPLKDVTDSINAICKELPKSANEAIDSLKSRAAKWQREENARLEAERRRIERERQERERKLEEARREEMERLKAEEEEEKRTAEIFGLTPDLKDIELQKEDVFEGSLQYKKEIEVKHAVAMKEVEQAAPKNVRKVWKFRVTDKSKVPDEFLIVDEKALGAAVRSGARKIEGVEIYFEETVVLR